MPPDPAQPSAADPRDHDILPLSTAERGGWTAVRPKLASLMDQPVLDAFASKITDLLAAGKRDLVLDFKEVEYISSSAIGFLVAVKKETEAAGGNLVLCGLHARLRELLKLTKLDRVFVVEPDVRTAMKNLGAV